MTHNTKTQRKLASNRRAVAPVIATLLLVAIAVVGGSIVFVFSQGFFSQAQVSGTPTIESLKFVGYDARDGADLSMHDGVVTGVAQGASSNGLITGERIAVYVQNQGVQKATLSEVRFAGTVYDFASDPTQTDIQAVNGTGVLSTTDPGYSILTKSPTTILTTTAAEIQPGQQVTLLIELDENIKSGRDAQLKLTTSNGAVFVGTVVAGQQSG